MANDDPRFRWRWVHGISPEVKASIDGRLIHDHESRLRAAFLMSGSLPAVPVSYIAAPDVCDGTSAVGESRLPALLISTGAFAQVPPNPDNPNDAIPDALAPPPYGEPINLETAKKVAAAAIAETTKRNWNAFCVSVVNPSGDLVYFEKQDNCQYASVGISQHKARTAARYRRPTLVFETLIGKGPYFAYLTTLDDVIASRGGNPLVVDGKVVGAIGVSGGSGSQDNVVSLAGQAALK